MNLSARLSCPAVLILMMLVGCNVKLVQPYDAELYRSTELFYKKAAAMVVKGKNSSPTAQQLATISPAQASDNLGHFSHFQTDYDELIVDSNALVIRSLANAGEVDDLGKQAQTKIEEVIRGNISAVCVAAQEEFSKVDLTTRNYIDLKCLVAKWKSEHQGVGQDGTADGRQILKKANWEGREITLFDSILAIQSAEAFKNKDER